jgi:hypothetical protein
MSWYADRTLVGTPTTVEELQTLFSTHNIPTELWGMGSAKTLEHLLTEVNEGESILTVNEQNVLVRKVALVSIIVRYGEFTLKEWKQVFKDGRSRQRDIVGIGEKLKPNETPTRAMNRGMHEELGIDRRYFRRVGSFVRTTRNEQSRSYPGLMCVYTVHTVTVEIDSVVFKASGYVERQSDKITYFKWVQA